MANHSSAWRKAKEATTGGKSNLTFAMYKAAVAKQANPLLAQFDASQRSLSYANSYSFRRWKFGVDVQLLKRAGNHQADKMHTILCLECNHNMNNKKIGCTAMWNGERANALAETILGVTKACGQ